MRRLRQLFRAPLPVLAINFVPRRRLFSGRGALLFVGGITALAAAGIDYLDFADQALRQASKSAYLESQVAKLSRAREASAVKMDPSEWHSLQQVGDELTYPWNRQLRGMERAIGEDVAVLSVQPEPKSGRLKILAETKTLDDAIGFAGRLKSEAGFRTVNVTHHEYRMAGSLRILGFAVQAQ